MRIISRVTLPALLAIGTFGQTSDTLPTFEIADVHVSAKTPNAFMRMTPARGTRYELKNATMVDLIRLAYNVDADKVLGGPSWLEMNRYDVIAKLPPDSTAETQKLMLQPLLADRFKLVVHKETKALSTFALTVGKKPQLKEADGTEQTGCRPQGSSGAPAEGGVRLMMASPTGAPTTINLGPGMVITYQCRNMTMEAFAGGLRGMMGANVGPNQVLDQTGLKGAWNFDVKWSMTIFGPMPQQGEHISMSDAFEKQLGLKLEERQVPTPVIVVDRVNEKPTDNPPGVSEALPTIPPPTEFEVADVKPVDPGAPMGGRFQIQPGGRLIVQGMQLRFLIARAFSSAMIGPMNNDSIVGIPKFADTDRYDITAKAPSAGPSAPALDQESLVPMMRALLVERFGMKYHMEERPMPAFALVAAKPKMKKADPNSRTNCKYPNSPAGAPQGSRVFVCQNTTMAQLAERLMTMGGSVNAPVYDATGLEGGWDFTITFSPMAGMNFGPRGGSGIAGAAGPDGGGPGMPAASEPVVGYTLMEAVEKQLGLKLESQKRPMQVVVIDHLEQKPTEN